MSIRGRDLNRLTVLNLSYPFFADTFTFNAALLDFPIKFNSLNTVLHGKVSEIPIQNLLHLQPNSDLVFCELYMSMTMLKETVFF